MPLDLSKPFEVVADPPQFDPSKPFEPVVEAPQHKPTRDFSVYSDNPQNDLTELARARGEDGSIAPELPQSDFNLRPAFVPQVVGRFMQSAASPVAGALESIGIAATKLSNKFGDPLLEGSAGDYKVEDRPTYKLGLAIRKKVAEAYPIDETREKSFLVDTLPSAAGSMAGFIAGGAAGKALKASGAASVALLGAGAQGAETFDEAIKSGASDEDAFEVFMINAGLGTTEAIPIAGWLSRLNKASGNRLKRAIIEGSQEAAQEVVQQFGSNLTAQKYYDPDRSWSEGLIEGGGAGFTLGSLASLLVSAIGGRRARATGATTPTPVPELAQTPTQDLSANEQFSQELNQRGIAAVPVTQEPQINETPSPTEIKATTPARETAQAETEEAGRLRAVGVREIELDLPPDKRSNREILEGLKQDLEATEDLIADRERSLKILKEPSIVKDVKQVLEWKRKDAESIRNRIAELEQPASDTPQPPQQLAEQTGWRYGGAQKDAQGKELYWNFTQDKPGASQGASVEVPVGISLEDLQERQKAKVGEFERLQPEPAYISPEELLVRQPAAIPSETVAQMEARAAAYKAKPRQQTGEELNKEYLAQQKALKTNPAAPIGETVADPIAEAVAKIGDIRNTGTIDWIVESLIKDKLLKFKVTRDRGKSKTNKYDTFQTTSSPAVIEWSAGGLSGKIEKIVGSKNDSYVFSAIARDLERKFNERQESQPTQLTTRAEDSKVKGKEVKLPAEDTRTPVEILNSAAKIKLSLPAGANMVRVTTRYKDRDIVSQPISKQELEKANTFINTGVVKVEAGSIGQGKKFIPAKGKIEIRDAKQAQKTGIGENENEQSSERLSSLGGATPDKQTSVEKSGLSEVSILEKDLEGSGKFLRAEMSEISKLFADSGRPDTVSGEPGTGEAGSSPDNGRAVYPSPKEAGQGVFEKTRVFVATEPKGTWFSTIGRINILAHRVIFGSNDANSSVASFNLRLGEKLKGVKFLFYQFDGLAEYRPEKGHIFINSNALATADFSNPKTVAMWDAVITEELLHATSANVSTKSEIESVWTSLTPAEQSEARRAYDKTNRLENLTDYSLGQEYIRMILQERLTGEVTELHGREWGANSELKQALRKIVDFLKGIFGQKPSNNIARQIIERIEGAIKGEPPILRNVFESGEPPIRSNISEPTKQDEEKKALNSKAFKANAELADELGIITPQDDESGVPTKVGDVYDMVLSRPGLNAAVREDSVSRAANALNEAGLKAVASDDGLFRLADEKKSQEAAGQRLVSILEREIQSARADNRPERIANLLNTVVVHLARDKNQAFSQALKNRLYYLAQGERSSFGRALGGLAMWGKVLANVAQNPKLHLDRIYSDAFGGDLVRRIMDRIASNFKESFSGEEIERLYNANPKLRELFDSVVNRLQAKPTLKQVIDEIFATPIYRQDDLVNRFVDTMVNKFSATPEEAAKLKAEFSRTFQRSFAAARNKAQEKALKSLTPQEAKVIGKGTPLWKKITNLVNAGGFDSGEILTAVAKEHGWTVPTESELSQMREWSAREQRLREPSQRQIDKFKGDIAKATKEAETGTEQERIALIKKIQSNWSRWSMPVKWLSLDSVISKNRAKAINEFVGANLLLKFGFAVRQMMDVGIVSMPLNAVNRSLVHIVERAQTEGGFSPAILKDLDAATREAVTARIASVKATLRQMERTLTGHTSRRVLDRMTHSIGIFERMAAKADALEAKGNIAGARAVRLATLLQAGYRIAATWDSIQSVGLEWQEMRQQLSTDLRVAGKTHAEITTQLDDVFGGLKVDMLEALKEAETIGLERGLTKDKATLQNDAWNLIKAKAYDRMREATGGKRDYQAENEQLRELHSWNLPETGGIGGLLAETIKTIRSKTEKAGVPTGGLFSFGNAIGIAANRMATFSGGGLLGGWGFGDSPWYQGERNIRQRRIEAVEGLAVIGLLVALAAAGKIIVQAKYPADKDEKEKFIAEGHKLNTIRFVNDDGSWIETPIQMSPFSFIAPPVYMIGGIQQLLTDKARAQAKLDTEAARTGAVAGKVKGVSAGDVASVLAQGGYGFLTGGRTAGGAIQSFSDYGNFNLNKSASAFVTPYIPALPAWQETARMMGAAMDTRTATMAELLVPSPWSGHQRVNSLGDPLTNPDAVKRVLQVLTGGYSYGSDKGETASSHAYQQLFQAGYSTPEIPSSKGFNFDGVIRPMTPQEREKYTVTRGKAFKQELEGVNVDGLPQKEAYKVVQQAYQRANNTALGAISATPNMRQGRYVMPSFRTASTTTRPASFRPVRYNLAPRTRSAFGSRTRKPRRVALGKIKAVKIRKMSMFGKRTRSAFRPRRRGLYA